MTRLIYTLFFLFYFSSELFGCRIWAVISKSGYSLNLTNQQELNFVNSQLNALFDQSQYNQDGWAVIRYGLDQDNVNDSVFRSTLPANQDSLNYWFVMNGIFNQPEQNIAIAHIRTATSGASAIPNPHPWVFESDRTYSFVEISNSIFKETSLDLIYARQDQTTDQWSAELKRAIELETTHLSLYQLTIEHGTAFGNLYKKGKLNGLPSDDHAASLYELTQDLCNKYNLTAYEISNHSKPKSESKHNLIYWKYGDYLGIGPGAHGRVTINNKKMATEAERNPDKWLNAVTNEENYEYVTTISPLDQAKEYILMGLRISEGISLSRLDSICDHKIKNDNISHLTDLGLITLSNDRLSVNANGRLVLNRIIDKLLEDSFH